FVLLATKGEHPIFQGEEMRDFRRDSLKFAGHSIGFKRGRDGRMHASVRIHPKEYLRIRDYFAERAARTSAATLESELSSLPFEPYAPVRIQLLSILRKVNLRRTEAGFEPVSRDCLRLVRRQVRPFERSEGKPFDFHGRG